MNTLVDIARGALSRGAIDNLSFWAHEPSEHTRRTLDEALPLSVVAMADKARGDGAATLLRQLQASGIQPLDERDLGRAVADPVATQRLVGNNGFATQLFGSKLDRVVDRLSADTGISQGSATKLLGVATSMVAGLVGKTVASRHLDAAGLGQYLGEQERAASDLVPAALAREVMPPIVEVPVTETRTPLAAAGTTRAAPTLVTERVDRVHPTEVEAPRRGLGYLPWLLGGAALLALLLWGIGRGRRHEGPVVASSSSSAIAEPAAQGAVPAIEPRALQQPSEPPGAIQGQPPSQATAPAGGAPQPGATEPGGAVPPARPGEEAPPAGAGQQATAPAGESTPAPGQATAPAGESPAGSPGATSAPAEEPTPAEEPPPAAAPGATAGLAGLGAFLAGSEPLPRTFELRGVNFASGSAALDPASSGVLDEVVAALNEHPTAEIQLVGHTDGTGSRGINQSLSRARAEAAKRYLTEAGIAPDRINTAGRGSSEPSADNASSVGRAENRRLDLVVTQR